MGNLSTFLIFFSNSAWTMLVLCLCRNRVANISLFVWKCSPGGQWQYLHNALMLFLQLLSSINMCFGLLVLWLLYFRIMAHTSRIKFYEDIVNWLMLITSSLHHCYPQCNGIVEKFNGALVTSLKKPSHLKPKAWDEYIPMVLYSYRVRSHEAITMSPYELMYGIAPLPHENDLLLQLGRSLGVERLIQLPELRQKAIQKGRKKIGNFQGCSIYKEGTYVLKRNPLFGDTEMEIKWVEKIHMYSHCCF